MGGVFSHSHRERIKSSGSKRDISNTPTKFLMKLLIKLSAEEGLSTDGISREVFTRYMFKEYPDLSNRIFNFLTKTDVLSPPVQMLTQVDFQHRIQEILNTTSYDDVCLMYIHMYCGEKEYITSEEFQPIVTSAYNIFVDNHPDGPQICPYGINAIQSLLESLFRKRIDLKTTNLVQLMLDNCPHMIYILHSYVLHKLSIAYREIVEPKKSPRASRVNENYTKELLTIAPSKVWILATILPNIYMHPLNEPDMTKQSSQTTEVDHFDYVFPTHWCLLYDRNKYGCSANMFINYVFDYRGPTIIFLFGKHDKDFCVCVSNEWRESLLFWGDSNCFLIQLSPVYRILHKGPGIIYGNFSGNGFHGLQIGTNPSDPTVTINDTFDKMHFNGKKIKLHNVEVWGCGPPHIRHLQLDIKNWIIEKTEMQNNKLLDGSQNDNQDKHLSNVDKQSNPPSTST